MAKRSFYSANAILEKVGGRAPEDVILELIRKMFACITLWFGSVSSAKIRYQFVRFCCESLFHETVSDK